MNRFAKVVVATIITVLLIPTSSWSTDQRFLEYVQKAKKSVYRVETIDGVVLGSAFMINKTGTAITCCHILGSPPSHNDTVILQGIVFVARINDSTINNWMSVKWSATVVAVLLEKDFAVLQVDLQKYGVSNVDYLALRTKQSQEGMSAALCSFISNDPFNSQKPFLSVGIISTIWKSSRFKIDRFGTLQDIDILQLDLNLSRGSSGAPVFLESDGMVIAICAATKFQSDSTYQSHNAVSYAIQQFFPVLDSLGIAYDAK